MLKSILFGPGSLASTKTPSRTTQGRVWGLTFTTPGAIAHMAILVCYSTWFEPVLYNTLTIYKAIFLHSPDTEFAISGTRSKIPYQKWFDHYKGFLMKNSEKREIVDLLAWWNGRVFSFDSVVQPDKRSEDSSGMEEAELILNSDSDYSSLDGRTPAVNRRQDDYESGINQDLINQFDNLAVNIPDTSSQQSKADFPPPVEITSFDAPAPNLPHASSSKSMPEVVANQGDIEVEITPPESMLTSRQKPKRGRPNINGKQKRSMAGIGDLEDTTENAGGRTRSLRPRKV